MTQPPPPQSPGVPAAPGWGGPPPRTIYPGSPTAGVRTSGLAIASLVTGLLFWACVVPGIVAIVLGHVALESIDDSGGTKSGRGLAITGIVLGWVGIGIVGLLVVWWFITVLTI